VKILFGMPAPDSWGGPAACEPPFVDALKGLGVETAAETYVYGDKDTATTIFSRFIRVIRTALRFRKIVSAERFDLVHLNTAFDKNTVLRDSISIFLMGRKRPKIFLKIHGSGANFVDPRSIFYRSLIRYLDKRVAGYGIFTHEERETFLPHGIDARKFHFVKNVIQLETSGRVDNSAKEATDRLNLIFVSRFIKTKGLLETIKAVKIARDNGANVSLVCVGDGPIRHKAESLVKELGITEDVLFTGYISEGDVDEQLARSDIFVFPTRHNEGFPIAMFKAAISGLGIVTTRVRAAAEYFEDRVNCLFCSSKPDDIADKIVELINDKELRMRVSEANRKFGAELSPDNIASEYLAIYKKVISES